MGRSAGRWLRTYASIAIGISSISEVRVNPLHSGMISCGHVAKEGVLRCVCVSHLDNASLGRCAPRAYPRRNRYLHR